MKKTFFILLTFMLSGLTMSAQTVSESVAQSRAAAFFANQAQQVRKAPGRVSNANQQLTLAYTARKDGNTCFYVYNRGDNDGFVIIGGDEVSEQILLYSNQGHFDFDNAPSNFKNLLSQYSEQISAAKVALKNQSVKSLAKRTPASPAVQKTDIADLITTTWDQTDPYNRAIPKLVNSITGEEYTPPTGCVATATAQIMKYWNYPQNGVGQETRVLDYSLINAYNPGFSPFTPEFGTVVHDINYAETTYDWANMLDSYTGEETEEQINAVSTLMYHVGIACRAVYGTSETTGAMPTEALQTHFNYSPKAIELNRNLFDDETWEDIIYTELKLERPVLYCGDGSGYVGHQYIIHGYSSQYDMYKVNWGWGGGMDCYCKLTPTPDSGSTLLGYEYNQTAVIRLQPATMDSETTLDYGDTFWSNGVKYSIISSVFNQVEVTRPEREESQYADTIDVPAIVNYQGIDYAVIGLGVSCFEVLSYFDEHGNESWSPYSSQIKAINLANGLRYIKAYAFQYCGNIEYLEIPNSVSSIGWSAFAHCLNLKNVTLTNNIKEIPDYCFDYCWSLAKVDVPEGISSLRGGAFRWCTELKLLALPSSLDSIGYNVFDRCDNLDVLICKATTPPAFPEGSSYANHFTASASNGYLLVPAESVDLYKETIHWKNWKHILPLDSVDINTLGDTVTIDNISYKLMPGGAEVIEVSIYNVPKITIPDVITANNKEYKVTSIGSSSHFLCDTIVLPQYLSTIKSYAFQYSSAKEIVLPPSVAAIGSNAFDDCMYLERVILPDSIEEIPENCFSYCHNLFLLELPKKLKKINYHAITNCPNLFTFVCKSETVPVWDNSLENYANFIEATLYVPSNSVEDYRSSKYWKDWRFIKSLDLYNENTGSITVEHNGLTYRLLEHGAVLIGYPDVITEENLIIPENVEYEGRTYDVISIGQNALSGQNMISDIQLPSSLHSILRTSFYQCQGLKSVCMCDNIEYIADWAFENCTNLKNITIPSSLKVFGSFLGGTAIEKLIFPEGIESVEKRGGSTFSGMASLKEVVLPSSLRMIRTYGYTIRFNDNTERVYILSPDSISGTIGCRQTTAYVPSEYLEKYQNENDENNFLGRWYFKEVLPIIPLSSFTITKDIVPLTSGQSDSLEIAYSPLDASLQYVKWTSTDPNIASVDANGVVTAKSAGTTTITATSMYYPELSDTCVVTVTQDATGLNSLQEDEKVVKMIDENHNILILRGDNVYTLQGQEVK